MPPSSALDPGCRLSICLVLRGSVCDVWTLFICTIRHVFTDIYGERALVNLHIQDPAEHVAVYCHKAEYNGGISSLLCLEKSHCSQ